MFGSLRQDPGIRHSHRPVDPGVGSQSPDVNAEQSWLHHSCKAGTLLDRRTLCIVACDSRLGTQQTKSWENDPPALVLQHEGVGWPELLPWGPMLHYLISAQLVGAVPIADLPTLVVERIPEREASNVCINSAKSLA